MVLSDFNNDSINPNKFTTDPKRICKEDDIVLCIRATIGNVNFADKEYCLGRGVAALKPKEKIYRELIYFVFKRKLDFLKRKASGSVILGLTKPDINNSDIIIPSSRIILNFHKIFFFIFKKIFFNKEENKKLIILRDLLLPRLMSGKIRVTIPERNNNA